jgi:hypothetical protein
MKTLARTAAIVFALALAFAEGEPAARAQCGAKRSTCSACHDGAQAAAPPRAPWHESHAFADLCVECHRGRGDATTQAEAHVGLAPPLASAEACASCHGASAPDLLARYRDLRGKGADAGAAAGTTDAPPRSPRDPHGDPGRNLVLSAVITTLAFAGGLAVAADRRRALRGRS